MRTNQRYTRVRTMLMDEAIPRLSNGGIALCHLCQHSVYFAGGFLAILLKRLETTIRETRPPGTCPQCGATKLYLIRRYSRTRCANCRHEWAPTVGTAMRYAKKPPEWYSTVLALKAEGLNPRQIGKLMGCYDTKPIYEFLQRVAAAETANAYS